MDRGTVGSANRGRLQVEVRTEGHSEIVKPAGELDHHTADLLREPLEECLAKGFRRIDLNVLDWNPARGFYERIGFRWIRNWLPYRLSGEPLEKTAAGERHDG